MEKKKLKRKLIGFMVGEKGSIGKLQGLGLGIAGIIGIGLSVPKEVEGWLNIGDWTDNSWGNGSHDYNSPWDNTGGDEPIPSDWEFSDHPWSDGHSDSHNNDWDNWEHWTNTPPSVEVKVE